MNKGELVTAIIEDSHRADLAALVPRFIREGEGMIRRELVALPVRTTFGEADRSVTDANIYTLPTGIQTIRTIRNGDTTLSKVSIGKVRSLSRAASPLWFAEIDDSYIEIRGTPPTDTVFDIEYIGYPAPLVENTDTNSLLEDNETLYIAGAMFFLRTHTEEEALAQKALSTFYNVLEKLNEQYGRKYGGTTVAGGYNLFGGESSY